MAARGSIVPNSAFSELRSLRAHPSFSGAPSHPDPSTAGSHSLFRGAHGSHAGGARFARGTRVRCSRSVGTSRGLSQLRMWWVDTVSGGEPVARSWWWTRSSQPFAAEGHYHQRHVIAQPGVCGSPPLPSSSPSLGPPPACAAIAAPISCRRPARRICVWWCRCCRQVASSSYASIWGWRWSGAHSQPAATVPQPQAGLCGRRERAVALGGHVTWPVAATYVVG